MKPSKSSRKNSSVAISYGGQEFKYLQNGILNGNDRDSFSLCAGPGLNPHELKCLGMNWIRGTVGLHTERCEKCFPIHKELVKNFNFKA